MPDAWNAPPLMLKVKPELPEAVAAMLPLVAPGAVGFVIVPLTVIVIPAQGLGAVKLKEAEPVHPPLLFATIV